MRRASDPLWSLPLPPLILLTEAQMTFGQRLAVGTLWSFFEAWSHRLCHAAVFVALARLLSPADFGLASLALVAVLLGQSLFGSGGMADFLVQRPLLQPRHIATTFWLLVAAGMLLMLGFLALASVLAAAFDQPELTALIRAFAILLPLNALAAVPDALLRREFRFKYLALRSTLSVIAGGACGMVMAWWGFGVWSLLGFYLTHKLTEIVILWRAQPIRFWHRPAASCLREILGFAAYSSGARLPQDIDQVVMRGTVGLVFGVNAVGYFHFARSVLDQATNVLITPLTRVAMPAFSAVRGQTERLQALLRLTSESMALFAFPCFLGLAVTAGAWVPLVFGPQWSAASGVVQVLCLVGLTYPIGNLDVAVLRGLGRVDLEAKFSVIASLLLLAFLPPLAFFGLEGMAAALLLRSAVIVPLRFRAVSRCIGVSRRGEATALARVMLQALGMTAVVAIWQVVAPEDLSVSVIFAGSVAIGAATYAVLLAILSQQPIARLLSQARRTRAEWAAPERGQKPTPPPLQPS